jgi:hypothetical protein
MDLKALIKNTEDRYVSYKKLLGDMYKTSGVEDWFKDF